MVDVGDHLRSGDAERTDGPDGQGPVYRVVGTGESITLLRVTDPTGRRAYTGDVRTVPRELIETAFEPAADPDTGLAPRHRLRSLGSGVYWSVRRFLP